MVVGVPYSFSAPLSKKIHFKMRSSRCSFTGVHAYFRAQMTCVPGMVTEFALNPFTQTAEYRSCLVVKKVANSNATMLKKEYLLGAR
jgi:cytochrome c oxidase subunit 2